MARADAGGRRESQAREGMTESEALAAIERDYKFAMGIAPREVVGVLYGPDGEPLRADVEGLANSMRDRNLSAERYILWVRPTIQNPYEILLGEVETSDGKILRVKKYIGLYKDDVGRRESLVVYAVESPEHGMWNMHHFVPVPEGELDNHGAAIEVLYVKPG